MAVYAAEVTAEESDMANDAEPDMMKPRKRTMHQKRTRKTKQTTGYGTEYTGNGYRDIRS